MTKRLAAKDEVIFDLSQMGVFDQSPQIVILPNGQWDLSLLLALMTYTEWKTRWENLGSTTWDELQAKLDCLRRCLMSGCDLVSVADILQNALFYNEKGIAQLLSEISSQQQPTENRVTLKEYFDAFENDDKIQYAPIYGILSALSDILPTELQERYYLEDPADFTAKIIDSLLSNAINLFQTGVQAVSAAAETGEVAADAIDVVGTGLDTIFSGITAGALSFSAIADLVGLFKSGNEPASDENPDLRANVRVLNEVFVEGDAVNVNCSPDVIVNCGGGGNYQIFDGATTLDQMSGSEVVNAPDPEEDPPSGFSSWEEYYTYLCNAANYVLDNVLGTFSNMATLTGVSGAIALGVVIGLLIVTVPPIGIMAALAALTAIATIDLALFGTFNTLVSDLTEQREEIICGLYTATDTEVANSVIIDACSTLINSYTLSEAVKTHFNNFVTAIVTNDATKCLFEYDENAAAYNGETACDECVETCPNTYAENGTIESETPNQQGGYTYVISSEPVSSYHEISIFFNANGVGQYCGEHVLLDFLSSNPSPITKWGTDTIFRVLDQSSNYVHFSDSPWDGNACCGRLQIISNAPFTVTVDTNGEC